MKISELPQNIKKLFLAFTTLGCVLLAIYFLMNFLVGNDSQGFQNGLICLLASVVFYLFLIIEEKDAEISKLKDSKNFFYNNRELKKKYDEVIEKYHSIL